MTQANPIEGWLRKRFAQEAGVSVFMGVAAIALGIVVVFFTFWLAYVAMWFAGKTISAVPELIAGKSVPWPHWWRMLGAGCFVVLLIRHHLKTSPWHRGSYADADATPDGGFDPLAGAMAAHGGGFTSLAHLLWHPAASSRMILEILETGPRLLTGSRTLFRQADALRRMDPAGCAWVLLFLAGRTNAVPREELIAAWPEAEWPKLWAQLRLIDGLVFLEKGLSLRMDLRDELKPLLTGGQPQP